MKYIGFFLLFINVWMVANIDASYLSDFDVEAKVSVFIPSSKIIKRIHSDAIPYYELEVAKTFYDDWHIWLGAGYFSSEGNALGCGNKTSFHMVPITFGLKYFYSLNPSADLYIGVGACWSFFNNKDHSEFVHEHISDNSLGGIFKIGLTYYIKESIFIDLFTEYLYQRFSFKHHYEDHYTVRHNLNMSGFKIGAGLGYAF